MLLRLLKLHLSLLSRVGEGLCPGQEGLVPAPEQKVKVGLNILDQPTPLSIDMPAMKLKIENREQLLQLKKIKQQRVNW